MEPRLHPTVVVPGYWKRTFDGLLPLVAGAMIYWATGDMMLRELEFITAYETLDWAPYLFCLFAWAGFCHMVGGLVWVLFMRPLLWLALWAFDHLHPMRWED